MTPVRGTKTKSSIDELRADLASETALRHELEQRLKTSEEGFSSFTLRAVHDLREPLRSITLYSQMLSRGDKSLSAEQTEQFQRHIREGAAKMQGLMTGMVDCITANEAIPDQLRADMNHVLHDAREHLAAQSGGASPEVTSDPLPVVRGDAEKLVKVLRNLLENAARYCGRDDCRIHVSAVRDGDDWVLLVKDNGPGIEVKYQQKIFEPFERLHGREVPGCGLGLAICRRTIESHGGRMWVESPPGEGAAFCFTLAAA